MVDLVVKSLSIEGAFGFQNPAQVLELDGLGRVRVSGDEGSGKSSLGEVLTVCLYGQGSSRLDRVKLGESGIVNLKTNTGMRIATDMSIGERQLSAIQTYKHKKSERATALQLLINGVDKTPDVKKDQRALLARELPLTYAEWMGVVYLSQGTVHGLLTASAADKRSYLASAFGLDVYEAFVIAAKQQEKQFKALVASALPIAKELAELRAQLATAEEQLMKLGGVKAKADVEQRKLKLEAIVAKLFQQIEAAKQQAKTQLEVDKLRQAISQLPQADRHKLMAEYQTLSKQLADVQTRNERASLAHKRRKHLKSELDSTEKKMRSLRRSTREALAASVLETADQWLEVENELRGEFSGHIQLGQNTYTKKPSPFSRCSLCNKEKQHHKAGTAHCPVGSRTRIGYTSYDQQNTYTPAAESGKSGTVRSKAIAYEKSADVAVQLMRLSKTDHKNCPTCTRELQPKLVSKLLSEAESKQLANEQQLAQSLPRPLKVGTVSKQLAVARHVKQRAEDELQAEASFRVLKIEKKRLLAELSELPAAELVDASKLTRRLEQIKEQVDQSDKRQRLRARLSEAKRSLSDSVVSGAAPLTDKLSQAQAKLQELEQRMRKLLLVADRVSQLQTDIVKWEKRAEESADTAAKLHALTTTTIPYLQALKAAKVDECLSVLRDALPAWIEAMFGVGTGAKMQIANDERTKSVTVKLMAKHGRPWTTPLQASGGQRKRFTLALLAALREVTPRRANLVFMDEPLADMKQDGKMRFLNYLLPMMLERCPGLTSIFVVAHDTEALNASHGTFDKLWRVTLDKRKGSLVNQGR